MLAAVLLTACALCAAVCGYAAVRSMAAADRAARSEARLLRTQGAVKGLEGSVEALDVKWRKINGRLSQLAALIEDAVDDAGEQSEPPLVRDVVANGQRLPVCENWQLSQTQGPTSRAAKCDCAYCAAMRAQRASFRAAALPKTAAAQAAHAREHFGK